MKKRRLGIRAKFFLEVGAIIAVCLLGIAFVNSQLLESVYLRNLERDFYYIAENAEKAGQSFYPVLEKAENTQNVSIDLYDENDNFLYEGKTSYLSGNRINVISRKTNDDGSYFNVVCAEGSTTQYILYGKTFKNNYHIEISTEINPIQESASLATTVTTAITVMAMVFALIFIYDYSRRFTKPLIQMNNVMQRIAELDFSVKTDIDRNDEIGTLAANINRVSDSLDAALTALREKNEQLQEDIERERELERQRQDFVSSASHELKTPIAIIRGYAEGLKMSLDEMDEASREYCDIIIHEADKMNELVISMLEQSLYESGVIPTEKETFDVKEYIEEFLKSAEPIFKEKAIEVRCIAESVVVVGNKKQLTTVLSNIVLNACSHVKGENIIEVTTELQDGFVKVCVFNTGSFISDKDKDGIFTSFYRADKAHSRKEGRFGLGLSIVKSIITKHGCDCGFENKENGVTFWYTIERNSNEY